jgi:hypothetical protein
MSLTTLMRALPVLLLAAPRFVEMRELSGIDYVNVTGEREKRFIVSSLGTGAALFDYDQDGDLDLYFVNGAPIVGVEMKEGPGSRLYRNQGGWTFEDATEKAGVGHRGFGQGCAVSDFDNDGFPISTSRYRRERPLPKPRSGPSPTSRSRGRATELGNERRFFDAEGDGDLDLYPPITLIRAEKLPSRERSELRWIGIPSLRADGPGRRPGRLFPERR